MHVHICNDVLNVILNFLPLTDIYSMKLLNKYYGEFIDTNFMLENYVHPKANKNIIQKHQNYLKKIIICNDKNIYDDYLAGCNKLEVLDLKFSNITDKELKFIPNVQKLSLYYNTKITDEGLKFISNVRYLGLGFNNNITDKGLKFISNATHLILDYNTNITDEGLKYIPKIQHLELCCNGLITNEGLKFIPNIRYLDLGNNKNITNEGLKYISDVQHLNLGHNRLITDDIFRKKYYL